MAAHLGYALVTHPKWPTLEDVKPVWAGAAKPVARTQTRYYYWTPALAHHRRSTIVAGVLVWERSAVFQLPAVPEKNDYQRNVDAAWNRAACSPKT